jgi:hypothetical protein
MRIGGDANASIDAASAQGLAFAAAAFISGEPPKTSRLKTRTGALNLAQRKRDRCRVGIDAKLNIPGDPVFTRIERLA